MKKYKLMLLPILLLLILWNVPQPASAATVSLSAIPYCEEGSTFTAEVSTTGIHFTGGPGYIQRKIGSTWTTIKTFTVGSSPMIIYSVPCGTNLGDHDLRANLVAVGISPSESQFTYVTTENDDFETGSLSPWTGDGSLNSIDFWARDDYSGRITKNGMFGEQNAYLEQDDIYLPVDHLSEITFWQFSSTGDVTVSVYYDSAPTDTFTFQENNGWIERTIDDSQLDSGEIITKINFQGGGTGQFGSPGFFDDLDISF